MTDVDRILHALERLPVPVERQEALLARAEEFVGRIMLAGFAAGIRPAPVDHRGTPGEILAGVRDVSRGLSLIERGLGTIDGARRSTASAATVRAETLADMHERVLKAIAGAVGTALPTASIRAADLDASAPTYTPLGFTNNWRGAFARAAGQVEQIAVNTSRPDLRAPKTPDDWFVAFVGILAGIYSDATGAPARAYARGQSVDEDWRPPFCQFVSDLWPLFAREGEPAPSDSRIRDARANTSKLLSDLPPE